MIIYTHMKYKELKTTGYQDIAKKYNISLLAAKILSSKDLAFSDMDKIMSAERLYQPDKRFFNKIINRIIQAKRNNEKIIICGDYDCDGICATTIMYKAITKLGIQAGYYIPNRLTEGYGVSCKTIQMASKKGYNLLITVDNGVKAKEALSLAKSLKMDVIITDHHHYNDDDLICDYFLHPDLFHDYYQNMCGAELSYLIFEQLHGEDKNMLILAGIATIGDAMPLIGFNRYLVKRTLNLLNQGYNDPIQALESTSQKWTTNKISFQIVQKLNSIGRMANIANVNRMVNYLLLNNDDDIEKMSLQITDTSIKRKQLTDEMNLKALNMIDENDDFIIIYDKTFSEGINGIVASKICDSYQKPCVIFSENKNILKGSIRSNSIDLTTFFDEISDDFLAYGGHKFAAGISIDKDYLNEFIKYCNKKIRDCEINEPEIAYLGIESKVSVADLKNLDVLEPFGQGFEKPYFMIDDHINDIKILSQGKHLKYLGDKYEYLLFNRGKSFNKYDFNKYKKFIGDLDINEFRGKTSINMIVSYIIDE